MDCHFSIITVCLNEAATIRRTCESVCSQSFHDFEWIIVDGGSTDGTLGVLEGYGDQITTLISRPDAGIYSAMNNGILEAMGDYLVFMNAGDFFADPDVLKTVANAPPKDILYGDLLMDGENPSIIEYPDKLKSGYLLKNMLPHQASFIRRNLFNQYGLHDESYRIAGDYEMFVRLLEVAEVSHHHIPRVLAVLSDGGVSRSPTHRMQRKRENHRVRKKYFPSYRYTLKHFREQWRCRVMSP